MEGAEWWVTRGWESNEDPVVPTRVMDGSIIYLEKLFAKKKCGVTHLPNVL
jgi:hypothetical protein